MAAVQSAPVLLARSVRFRLSGRVHFVKECIGEVHPGSGEDFVTFRKMVLDPTEPDHHEPGALFTVRFRFKNLSSEMNKRLSLIPAPFIVTQPGFRSKTWMLGEETGMFQGSYEWDTVADAEAYWTSFPMRLMKRRAVPESIRYEVTAR